MADISAPVAAGRSRGRPGRGARHIRRSWTEWGPTTRIRAGAGICSTLAVTNVVTNTVVMCLGLIWATAMSNLSVSILRKWIPARSRMMVETLIIAVWVIIVDIVLRAYLPDISARWGPTWA